MRLLLDFCMTRWMLGFTLDFKAREAVNKTTGFTIYAGPVALGIWWPAQLNFPKHPEP